MQRLFIFVLLTRGFLTSGIHARTAVNSTEENQFLEKAGGERGLVENGDGTWSLDPKKLAPMSVTNDLSLGYCSRQPGVYKNGVPWSLPSQDSEYYTVRANHKKYLDTKPGTGCPECMEIAAWLIQEGDDGRVCDDLKNNTSPCMKARTLTMSEGQFQKNGEKYLNFQLTCRCAIKYQCDIIASEPLQWLGAWELDKMLHGRDYAKIAGLMEDAEGQTAKAAQDFSPTIGWHEDKAGPNANSMYGIGGLTGERANAKDLKNADINSGVVSRDLMRDSGDNYHPPDRQEINEVTGDAFSAGFLQIHTESNEKPVV